MLFSQRGINSNKISVCLSIYLSFQIDNLPSRIIPGGDDTTIAGSPYSRKAAKDCGKCIQQAPIWRPILLTRIHLLLALFLCHLSQTLVLFRTLARVWFLRYHWEVFQIVYCRHWRKNQLPNRRITVVVALHAVFQTVSTILSGIKNCPFTLFPRILT